MYFLATIVVLVIVKYMTLNQPSHLNSLSQWEKEAAIGPLSFWERVRVRALFLWLILFIPLSTSAFLWSDLGLDIYGQIDKNYKWLEQKQYEHELTAQWEADINEVLEPIFADYGVTCNIGTSADIDSMLSENNIAEIVERCSWQDESVPAILAERVSNALWYIKNTYTQRAETKAQKTFEVERIWLYSDGNIENSPFDLVEDLIQIDTIIFTQELEYEWVARDNAEDDFERHISGEDTNIDTKREEEIIDEDISIDTQDWPLLDPDEILWEGIIDFLDYHSYVCVDPNQSGLDNTISNDIIWDIEWFGAFVSNPRFWEYPEGIVRLDGWWDGPTLWWNSLTGNYSPVRDDFPCDWFFCITIEFQKSDYGLAGWESNSIESILQKAGKHIEKPANASLTQRKQTTNNFELWSIIDDLPGMLRGFWIDVSSKPVPILDLENEREESVQWDLYEVENLLSVYYKNQWLDYERRNDLSIFGSREHEQKVFQTAGGMPIWYTENRLNELAAFQNALRENNRIISQSVNNEIITKDLQQFSDLFAELEVFTLAIEDFVFAFSWNLEEMKRIPTRSP